MKTKCPHPGLRDLRDRRDRNGAEAPRPKRKPHRKKVVARTTLERSASNAAAPAPETTPPADDIERESVPDPARTGRDIERE